MAFDLNKHAAKLLFSEPFFASISRRIDKKASKEIPTAGVRVNEQHGRYELIYNPEFFEELTEVQRLGVLKHEFYHLIFEHVGGRLPEGGMSKLWNVATDLAINSYIATELPDVALVPGKGKFQDLPTHQSAEWYYEALKDMDDEDENGDGEGGGEGEGGDDSFDDHSGWQEASQQAKEMAKQRMAETIKEAAEEAAKSRAWGSVGHGTQKDILSRINKVVDWKKVLRYFVKASQKANKSSSIKRINRRYQYVHPGRKSARTAKIAISIDQSGSVSDDMLEAFFGELSKLAEFAEFTVVPFDTDVAEDQVYTWKKGEKRKHERVRYGGTCFDAPTKWVNDRNFDGHIVLTDMCAPAPIPSKCQRMWMTTPEYAARPYFSTNERVIVVK